MYSKRLRIIMYILAVLPLAVFLLIYGKVPAQIPGHWNLDGTVRYDSKNTFFLISGLGIVLAFVFDIAPRIDPRRANYEKFKTYYDAFCIFMVCFLDVMCAIILTEAFRPGTIRVEKVVICMVGILFIVMGNMMPKFKSNFYIGMKTSWALSDDDVWNKTNRLGGQMMFWSGFVLILASFIFSGKIMFGILMAIVVLFVALPPVMSYIWYRKKFG